MAKGNLEPATCGGVFRDYNGHYLSGFCQGLCYRSTFFAKLMGVIIGVQFAYQFSWHSIWLERDPTRVLACITSSSFALPWHLRITWSTCLLCIRTMSFYCSHIFREDNIVADIMANLGLASPTLAWHESPSIAISPILRMDDLGFPYQRVA